MAISKYIPVFIAFGGTPLLGSVTSLLSAKIVEKFGHSFTQMGPQNYALIATIGLVQNTAALILAIVIAKERDLSSKNLPRDFFIANLITGVLLFGLTALAARVNLIARGLSLPGTALLIATGFVGTLLNVKAAILTSEYLDV